MMFRLIFLASVLYLAQCETPKNGGTLDDLISDVFKPPTSSLPGKPGQPFVEKPFPNGPGGNSNPNNLPTLNPGPPKPLPGFNVRLF